MQKAHRIQQTTQEPSQGAPVAAHDFGSNADRAAQLRVSEARAGGSLLEEAEQQQCLGDREGVADVLEGHLAANLNFFVTGGLAGINRYFQRNPMSDNTASALVANFADFAGAVNLMGTAGKMFLDLCMGLASSGAINTGADLCDAMTETLHEAQKSIASQIPRIVTNYLDTQAGCRAATPQAKMAVTRALFGTHYVENTAYITTKSSDTYFYGLCDAAATRARQAYRAKNFQPDRVHTSPHVLY